MSKRYEAGQEIIEMADDNRISANHICDQWNSQRNHPDLRFPVVVNITSGDGDEEEELRLSLDAARRVHGGLGRAIQEAERDLMVASEAVGCLCCPNGDHVAALPSDDKP